VAGESTTGNGRADVRAALTNDDKEEKAQDPLPDGIRFAGAGYNQAFEAFRGLTIRQLSSHNLYCEIDLTLTIFLARFIATFGPQADCETRISPEYVPSFFWDHLLFSDPVLLAVPWNPEVNTLWQHAHFVQHRANFAAISARWMALGTLEAQDEADGKLACTGILSALTKLGPKRTPSSCG
jgi:hypothetical protein